MTETVSISIITVCYDSSQFIRTAIESVLSQSYKNIEYIVIDGASTDGTMDIINEYKGIHRVICEPDEGLYDAMNKGVAMATGEVIGILNSDDFYPHSEVITEVVSLFLENPDIDMVLGNVDFVKSDNLTKIERSYSANRFSPWHLKFGFMPPHPGAFIKKTAYDKVGKYKLGYQIGADFDMFVRMLLVHKLSYEKLNKTLVRMRIGGVSTSGLWSYTTSTKEMLRSLKENQIYSNLPMVIMRLPVKFLHKILLSIDK